MAQHTHPNAGNREGVPGKASEGFPALLDTLVSTISETDTLAQIANRFLTLGGRQPYAFGLRSLSRRQEILLSLMDDVVPSRLPPPAVERGDTLWHIGIWDYGRMLLTDEPPERYCSRVVACLSVSGEVSLKAEALAQELESEHAGTEREVESFLGGLADQQLAEVLERVRSGIDHIDPILIYVNDVTFTNFEPYNNLLGKPGTLLGKLSGLPVTDWLPDERRFVACFYWVLKASMRGEEFNGLQLTPGSLGTHFDSCLRNYSQLLGPHAAGTTDSLAEKARCIYELRQEMRRGHFTYRRVNGLNFNKEEAWAPRATLRHSVKDLPRDLHRYVEDTYELTVSRFDTPADLFRTCVERATRTNAPESTSGTGVESLLEHIVISAAESLHSDIGMTRGIRDLRRWQKALQERRYGEMCEWPTDDYFCAVFPSARMRERHRGDPKLLAKILTACSVRMRYNSWHYMPGHFPAESIPSGRHYYYPPQMSDTAVWSDQHHAGHVMAAVRYSIRSPAPLEHGGRSYPGMIDIRLYRANGTGYTREEMFRAMEYAEYLRSVYQAVADLSAKTDRAIVIRSFHKQWFEQYCADCFDHPTFSHQ
jgi:hypothetical protein